METPKPFSKDAVQRERLWTARYGRKPTEVVGPDGEPLLALEHPAPCPLWLKNMTTARRLSAELAWKVAYDLIAVVVTYRGQVTACLRPLVAGECENLELLTLLRCDARDFPGRRSRVFKALADEERPRVVLQWRHLLLARLWPLPPLGSDPRASRPKPKAQSGWNSAELRLCWDEADEPSSPEPSSPESSSASLRVSEAQVPLTPEQAELVERHLRLVRWIAWRSARLVGSHQLSLDELQSVGYEALVLASRRYDPERSASFATYVYRRVFGAMMDAIRQRLRRPVTHEQQLVYSGPSREPNPEQALIAADERFRVRDLVDQLEPEDQAIVEAVYLRGQSMTSTAADHGVDPSTISRRHRRILDRLGRAVQDHGTSQANGSKSARPDRQNGGPQAHSGAIA